MTTKRLRGRPPAEQRRCQVAQLRSEGLSLRQVGERLGVSKEAVSSLLHYTGIGTGPRRRVILCGRCRNPVGPAVGSIGRYTHEDELTCVACVAKDRTAQFGTRMRALRLAAGLSVRELAAEIGMKAATLRYWEFAGKFPRADLVQRVGHVLGVDPRVLLNGESK